MTENGNMRNSAGDERESNNTCEKRCSLSLSLSYQWNSYCAQRTNPRKCNWSHWQLCRQKPRGSASQTSDSHGSILRWITPCMILPLSRAHSMYLATYVCNVCVSRCIKEICPHRWLPSGIARLFFSPFMIIHEMGSTPYKD